MKATVRRISTILLGALLCFMLTACGSDESVSEAGSLSDTAASSDIQDAAADLLAGIDTESDDVDKFAAQSDGDYMDDEYEDYDEEYDEDYEDYDEEYDEDYSDDSYSDDDAMSMIEEYDEVYAGDYGKEYQIILAFDWSDSESGALVMIYPNNSDQIEYFNIGELTGEIGAKQTIEGFSDYPFEFTITDFDESSNKMKIKLDDGGVCTLNFSSTSYLADVCEAFGMF